MKAALIRAYGAPIEIADVQRPAPGSGQLLVRVRAASLNPLDAKLRSGALRRLLPLKFPVVLGFDFAGEVEEGARGWSRGDRVYGRTDAKTGGTHAEFAVVGASVVDRIPERLSFEEAASLPLVACTAIQALRQARLAPGERLLVIGAGGVGSVALQIGRAMGAVVSAMAPAAGRVDVVLDTAFSSPTADTLRMLDRAGRYVSTGFSISLLRRRLLAMFLSRRRFDFIVSRANGELMREVSRLVTARQLAPVIEASFPLERIAEAHARLGRGHLRGKIVVTVS
jgi:NADPH:quinone reductase-like Zn-dependent oxidoreductase